MVTEQIANLSTRKCRPGSNPGLSAEAAHIRHWRRRRALVLRPASADKSARLLVVNVCDYLPEILNFTPTGCTTLVAWQV